MSKKSPVSEFASVQDAILVAGDVCLDVVGVPMPPEAPVQATDNWRLTGELRTHYLAGGAMMLEELVKAAVGGRAKHRVCGPMPVWPFGLCGAPQGKPVPGTAGCRVGAGAKPGVPMKAEDFVNVGGRLCRSEVVHSLVHLSRFPTAAEPDDKGTTLRVLKKAGFSGPARGEPTLGFRYPTPGSTSILAIDDTGNSFRKRSHQNPWPAPLIGHAPPARDFPWVVYKLHRPLPGTGQDNPLWDRVKERAGDRRMVVVSVDDLRAVGVPISHGLSWERTALDVVWHLQNTAAFAELRACPWLVVRLGLDGAVLWRGASSNGDGGSAEEAWLIYDPEAIEGSYIRRVPGEMVGFGSAFVAGLVGRGWFAQRQRKEAVVQGIVGGIRAGLLAARRLLRYGYGDPAKPPHLPGAQLFRSPGKDDVEFACQPIPIIANALTPDRGGWRLLDQVFQSKKSLLNRAVIQLATGGKVDRRDIKGRKANALLKQAPLAVFGKLRTHDRWEMEYYRSLHSLLSDYLRTESPLRPLSFAVFGPPGAGKSFGVKEVAASLKGQLGCREVEALTFNLSLYQSPEDLAGAFHLVRDIALEGKVPMVFFDEFDTALGGVPLGWLRHFLAPMQDGKFLDRGSPHPIGQSIFVFAGGTCSSFREFRQHPGLDHNEFRQRKGPDFLSRLRATLDIPSLNLPSAFTPDPDPQNPGQPLPQPPGTYNPFGPIESLPCEASILLRRASILCFNLKQKAPGIVSASGRLDVDPAVLRALLFLPFFEHGNRSFEALLDMSHLAEARSFSPSLLPPPFQIPLHADAEHFGHLVGTQTPFSEEDREAIARAIHESYIEERIAKDEYVPGKPSHSNWEDLPNKYKDSNKEQADDIPRKLLAMGLWLRKKPAVPSAGPPARFPALPVCDEAIELAARREHDRWVADQRTQGCIYGWEDNSELRTHPCVLPWYDMRLPRREKEKDEETVRSIPRFLAAADYEVINLSSSGCAQHT